MSDARPLPASLLPVRALAYIGDAVYELHVRMKVLSTGVDVDDLHRKTVTRVSASGQARLTSELQSRLHDDELQVFKRARNYKSSVPRRGSQSTYRLSTAFEAVLGYVKLKPDPDRLSALLLLSDTLFEDQNDAT